jgi:hypothetical protein
VILLSEDWERGYAAGWRAAMGDARRDIGADMGESPKARKAAPAKRKRKASAYNRRYSAAFKRLAPKYKTKSGGWKKDGFKRCSAAARKEAKR